MRYLFTCPPRHFAEYHQCFGWCSSAILHAAFFATALWVPHFPSEHRAQIAGARSVESIQLSFSDPAIAGEPEPMSLEALLTDTPLPEVELHELLPELVTVDSIVVEKVSLAKLGPTNAPVQQEESDEGTQAQGTARANSSGSPAAAEQTVGLDDVSPASPVRNPLPQYPAEAINNGHSGRVVLRITISAQGKVTELSVAVSSGHPHLDEAAMVAVRNWQFEPATRAGAAIDWSTFLPVRFRLN